MGQSVKQKKSCDVVRFSEESTGYYILEIERPAHLSPVHDEGMLLWFTEGSIIAPRGSKVGVSATRSGPDETSRVAFYEYSPSATSTGNSKHHFGSHLLHEEGKRLVEANQRPARMIGKLRHSFLGYHGTAGNGLPSIDAPLFVRGSLRCLMSVYCPRGYARPSFTVRACYTSTPPLELFRTKVLRTFNWVCNFIIFVCTCCIILLEGYAPAYALLIAILIMLVQVAGNSAAHVYWKGYYLGYNYSDALNSEHIEEWQKWCWRFCARKKTQKVRPIVAAASTAADDEDVHLEMDGDSGDGAFNVDVLDAKYLPRNDRGVDPFLASSVEKILKRQRITFHEGVLRHGESLMQVATEISKVACRGRIGVGTCATVLGRHGGHSDDTITLRLRSSVISKDLDAACKIADRKELKRNLVKDTIHGLLFWKEGMEDKGDDAWSGLDAFRNVIENEVQETKGTYDTILHSALNTFR